MNRIRHWLTIIESPENDVEAHKSAMKAFHQLSSYVSAHPEGDHLIEYGKQGDYIGYDGRKIGFTGTPIMIVMLGAKSSTNSTGSAIMFSEPQIDGFDGALVFNCLRNVDEHEAQKVVNTTKFLSLFQHEYIHALDFKRIKRDSHIPDTTNLGGYINDPAEYNARYHDLADSLLSILSSSPDNVKDLADLYGFTGNFTNDLSAMMNKDQNTKFFMKWLNDDRRKALLKRLYKLYALVSAKLNT